MNKARLILGIIVAILAVVSAVGVINKILHYDGSAFSSGEISGGIVVTCFAAAGSIMLFKSAKKKSKSSE